MIDPASAFCVGVYFLGVGVVGSVLYIPISLMRAIERYHLGRDGKKNRRNSLLDGDSLSNGYLNVTNNNNNGIMNGNNSSNYQPLCDDNSSLFFERPELLLIHKKKVLRNILNDNNYLNNLLEFDDKSDYSFGVYERFTTCQNSTSNHFRNEFKSSNKSQAKQYNSVINIQRGGIGLDFIRDVLSTTTPSDKDENDDQPEIVIDNENAIFSLKYFEHIGSKKEHDNHNNYGMYVCSSTNSTSSIISYDTGFSNNTSIANRKGYHFISDYQAQEYNLSKSNILRQSNNQDLKQGIFILTSSDGYVNKIKESMIIEEISAAHDILTL